MNVSPSELSVYLDRNQDPIRNDSAPPLSLCLTESPIQVLFHFRLYFALSIWWFFCRSLFYVRHTDVCMFVCTVKSRVYSR